MAGSTKKEKEKEVETGVPSLVGRVEGENMSESASARVGSDIGGEAAREWGEGERVQDVPVLTSVEGVVSNTHTSRSSTVARSSRPTMMTAAATTRLIP